MDDENKIDSRISDVVKSSVETFIVCLVMEVTQHIARAIDAAMPKVLDEIRELGVEKLAQRLHAIQSEAVKNLTKEQ